MGTTAVNTEGRRADELVYTSQPYVSVNEAADVRCTPLSRGGVSLVFGKLLPALGGQAPYMMERAYLSLEGAAISKTVAAIGAALPTDALKSLIADLATNLATRDQHVAALVAGLAEAEPLGTCTVADESGVPSEPEVGASASHPWRGPVPVEVTDGCYRRVAEEAV